MEFPKRFLFLYEFRIFKNSKSFQPESERKTLIFVETKRKADDLSRWMRRKGWPCLCTHGDKSQTERDRVMNGEIFFYLKNKFLKVFLSL